jgi:SecD/SecF fusion protein
MNTWLKSLVIGAVVAAIAFVVFQRMSKKRTLQQFTVHYELERASRAGAGPANHDETVDDLHKMSRVLQARCEHAGYVIKVKGPNAGEMLNVTVQHVTDTGRLRKLITNTGRIEVHEVYTLQELGSMIMPTEKNTEQVSIEAVPVENTMIDTGKAVKFSEKQPEPAKKVEPAPTLESLFKFGQQPDGAEIGSVTEKDTAAFWEIFKKEFRLSLPANARFYYGPSINSRNSLGVYAIRTYDNGSITIDNSDIREAMQDFDITGRPSVQFSFNSIGSRKWERLTRKNVSRPLAFLVDDIVIFAPRVESAITGGNATLNGDFTVGEARILADQLNSDAMPARFAIIKNEISRESSGINLKGLLILVAAFAIGTGASYLIFKLLKSN